MSCTFLWASRIGCGVAEDGGKSTLTRDSARATAHFYYVLLVIRNSSPMQSLPGNRSRAGCSCIMQSKHPGSMFQRHCKPSQDETCHHVVMRNHINITYCYISLILERNRCMMQKYRSNSKCPPHVLVVVSHPSPLTCISCQENPSSPILSHVTQNPSNPLHLCRRDSIPPHASIDLFAHRRTYTGPDGRRDDRRARNGGNRRRPEGIDFIRSWEDV
jgi:hypothetical protein